MPKKEIPWLWRANNWFWVEYPTPKGGKVKMTICVFQNLINSLKITHTHTGKTQKMLAKLFDIEATALCLSLFGILLILPYRTMYKLCQGVSSLGEFLYYASKSSVFLQLTLRLKCQPTQKHTNTLLPFVCLYKPIAITTFSIWLTLI